LTTLFLRQTNILFAIPPAAWKTTIGTSKHLQWKWMVMYLIQKGANHIIAISLTAWRTRIGTSKSLQWKWTVMYLIENIWRSLMKEQSETKPKKKRVISVSNDYKGAHISPPSSCVIFFASGSWWCCAASPALPENP
jgi:hypothetical protein